MANPSSRRSSGKSDGGLDFEAELWVSAALSAAHGLLAIVLVNLTCFRGGAWAISKREAAEKVQLRVADIQNRFYSGLSALHQEVLSKEGNE